MSTARASLLGSLLAESLRFALLTAAMTLAVGLLAAVEAAFLWQLGIEYQPKSWPSDTAVLDYVPLGGGQRGVSRVTYRRSADHGVERDLLLHDAWSSGTAVRMSLHGLAPQHLAAAASGELLAVASIKGTVHLCSAHKPNSPPRLLAKIPGEVFGSIACSPDGKLVAAAGEKSIYLWRLPGGELWRRLGYSPHGFGLWLCFSGDSRILLLAGRSDTVCLWDVHAGEQIATHRTDGDLINGIALSPDGAYAAYNAWLTPEVCLFDLKSGKTLWRSPAAGDPDRAIAFSSDGAFLAIVHRSGTRRSVQVLDLKTGCLRQQFAAHDHAINGLHFGPDRRLYAWSQSGLIHAWDLATQRETWRFSTLQWASCEPTLRNSREGWLDRR